MKFYINAFKNIQRLCYIENIGSGCAFLFCLGQRIEMLIRSGGQHDTHYNLQLPLFIEH